MFLLMAGFALAYEPVEGISFPNESEVEEYNFYHNIDLKYKIYRQANSGYYDSLIYDAIYSSTLASFKEIRSLGAIDKKCGKDDFIEIYEISENQLNDPSRFPSKYIGGGKTGRDPLWGYFDPRANEPGYNAIVITSHNDKSNYRVIVHEIAHHWYSEFCLDRFTKVNTEEFAIAIQEKVRWK